MFITLLLIAVLGVLWLLLRKPKSLRAALAEIDALEKQAAEKAKDPAP